MTYRDFLKSKIHKVGPVGVDVPRADVHPMLFDFQKDDVAVQNLQRAQSEHGGLLRLPLKEEES